jgi:quaternary ammonium compound-resistance protein SugE
MQWLFLILAAICEMLWFYCIAYLNKFSVTEVTGTGFMHTEHGWWVMGAIAGYIGFGIANMVFFAKSIQKIAPATAFSVWTGLTLVGITLCDGLLGGIELSWQHILSILFILAGVMGLKFYAKQ